MKICFLCNEYPPGPHGGIGTFTQVLGRGLAAAGHAVSVVGVYSPDHPAPDYEEDQGVRVWRLREPPTRVGRWRGRWRVYRTIARMARRGEVEIVEAPDWEGWTAGWRRLAAPLVIRLHGSSCYFAREMGRKPRRQSLLLEGAALRGADFWSSVSQYTADRTRELFGLAGDAAAILYNPVEMRPELPFERRSATDVVFSGTLTEKKGVIPLLQAWRRVYRQVAGATLHMYGKDARSPQGGSMIQYLTEQLPADARDSVVFHGHVERDVLFHALAGARVAVFPSYAEAFALAPLEAMSSGCPTIYSVRGSGPELIREGVDGLLCDPDDPGSIERLLIAVLTDADLARRIGEAGRARIKERFTLSTLVRENEAFFGRCIGAGGTVEAPYHFKPV